MKRNLFVTVYLMVMASCSSSGDHVSHAGTSRKVAQDMFTKNEIPWDFKKGEVTQLCDQFLAEAKTSLDQIAQIAAAQRTFDNSLLAFENTLADLDRYSGPLVFMKSVHKDKGIQAESKECEDKLSPLWVEIWLRRDLYNAIKDVKVTDAGQKRLKIETMKGFENNGLKLPDDKLAQLKKWQEEEAKLSSDFSFNVSQDNSSVTFSEAELAGAEADFLARLKKDSSGKYIVTTKGPDYLAVMENVTVAESRKKMSIVYLSRAAEKNVPLLKKILKLRQQMAELLGYKTWADYRTSSGRMAKSGDQVWEFINGLKGKLAIANQKDLKILSDFKKQIEPNGGPVQVYDISFLINQYKKKNLQVDDEVIKQYFPSDRTVEKMFDIYSKLLGVKFEKITNALNWSPDVNMYRIIDLKTKKEVAYFYADFVPREDKYEHAAAFNVRTGRILPDGTYLKPISAIVANFTPASPGKPILLNHGEVETLYHEFGHIMHQTLTKAPYASLAGTAVARDFVEAPSQMLENWVWNKEMLSQISGHYNDTQKKLPSELISKMLKARDFNQAGFYTRQLWLGSVDMTFHSNPAETLNTTEAQQKLYKEIVGVEPLPESRFEAGFGHLMGYSAGYYGYIWSEVFAVDMFTKFQSAGLLSSEMGGRYRKIILEQGNMKDADVLLKEFLGRAPSNKPFFKRLGLK